MEGMLRVVGGQWPLLRPMAMLGGHLWRCQLSLLEMNGSNAPWPVFQNPPQSTSVWPKTPLHRIQFISHVPKSQVYLFSVIVFRSAVALGGCVPLPRTSDPPATCSSDVLERNGFLWVCENLIMTKARNPACLNEKFLDLSLHSLATCSVCPSTHVTVGLVHLVVSDGVFLLLQRHVISAGSAPNSKALVLLAACKTLFEVMQLYLSCSIWGAEKTHPMVGKFEED